LKYIICTCMDISFSHNAHFCSLIFYMWYLAIYFSWLSWKKKSKDKHLCRSLCLIMPLVTSLTMIGPTPQTNLC
jgi:hypothetical protein